MDLPELNKVYLGNCLETIRGWPDEFVDCTVTSPPYYKLRSYLPTGHKDKDKEIGCGQSMVGYLETLLDVFIEVKRITKPTGVLWINIGDTFDDGMALRMPQRVATGAERAGWRLVSEVIWHKPNSQTSSNRIRPVQAHEYVFQFAKSKGYYFDPYPLMERSKYQHDPNQELKSHARSVWTIPIVGLNGRKLMSDFKKDNCWMELSENCPVHGLEGTKTDLPLFEMTDKFMPTICICKPVEADFFAAMPPELAERCIKCSTSDVGNCPSCGKPWKRVVSKDRVATRPGNDVKVDPAGKANKDGKRHVTYVKCMGFDPGCDCEKPFDARLKARDKPVVFDPFMGSGTTALAAVKLGRNYVGCELNELMVSKLIPARLKAEFARKK